MIWPVRNGRISCNIKNQKVQQRNQPTTQNYELYLKVKPVVKEFVTCCVIHVVVMLISSNYRRSIGGNALSRPVSLVLVKDCNHSTMGLPVLKPNKYPDADAQNWNNTFFIHKLVLVRRLYYALVNQEQGQLRGHSNHMQ